MLFVLLHFRFLKISPFSHSFILISPFGISNVYPNPVSQLCFRSTMPIHSCGGICFRNYTLSLTHSDLDVIKIRLWTLDFWAKARKI